MHQCSGSTHLVRLSRPQISPDVVGVQPILAVHQHRPEVTITVGGVEAILHRSVDRKTANATARENGRFTEGTACMLGAAAMGEH
jgi:hypothetical protein